MKKLILLGTSLFVFVIAFSQNQLAIPDTLSGTVINLNLQMGSRQFAPGNATITMGQMAIY